jgi:(1->4)-alpha-D-glucan 1-alpha-D-glucosylmutase
MDTGMPKLWVIYKALHLRREHPDWFGERANYSPLPVEGSKREHLVAFCRGESVAVLAPRWNVRLGGGFGSTTVELPAGHWMNVLSGEEAGGGKTRVQDLFRRFPVALLVRDGGANDASV